ncbi:hypothetical protein D3C84_807550 [compost metagenome]
MAVQFAERLLLADKMLLRFPGYHLDYDEAERQRNDRHERQQWTDRQHHDDDADERYDRRNKLRQALLQRAANVIDVVDGAAEHFAMSTAVEKFKRQLGELRVDVFADAVYGLLRNGGHHVLLDEAEYRTDNVQYA